MNTMLEQFKPICTNTCLYDYEPINAALKFPNCLALAKELTKEEMEKCRKVVIQ